MSLSNIITILMLAMIDAFNPATIATMMLLLPVVKKKWHSLIFVAGTYLAYFIFGFIVFIGVDKYIKSLFYILAERYVVYLGLVGITVAVILIIVAVFLSVRLINRIIKKEEKQTDYMGQVVKMVNPLSLAALAIFSTLSDMPTAIPYFGFISLLSASGANLPVALGFFIVYCLIYVLPMLILYIVFSLIRGERFDRIEGVSRRAINAAAEFLLPIMLLFIGILLLWNGLSNICS